MAGRRLLFGEVPLAASFEMVPLMHAHIMKTQRGARPQAASPLLQVSTSAAALSLVQQNPVLQQWPCIHLHYIKACLGHSST